PGIFAVTPVDLNSSQPLFSSQGMSAVAPDDTIVVVGSGAGDIDLGGGTLPGNLHGTGAIQPFGILAKYHSDGSYDWAVRFSSGTRMSFFPNSVTVAPNGDIIVVGFELEASPLGQENALWVATFDANGN